MTAAGLKRWIDGCCLGCDGDVDGDLWLWSAVCGCGDGVCDRVWPELLLLFAFDARAVV